VSALRFMGPLDALADAERAALLERATTADPAVRARVSAIVERVRRSGDEALRALARELDGVTLERLEVPRARIAEALARVPTPLRTALERAAANIERTHRAFLPRAEEIETEPGVWVGRRPDPLARVGVYAPGGRASYPSSVLMGAIPARVAQVGEVILCSPPGPEGAPGDAVLAAAAIAGVDRVFAIGGAGAIAAMALGTATVPRVDRVVGPGNAYVAEAKLQLAGTVGIDSPAGPSELLVIADDSADADTVALELVAQAEHDPRAWALALATSEQAGRRIAAALERASAAAARGEVVAAALRAGGGVLWAGSLADALAFAAEFAPEHLLLALADPGAALDRVRHAGAVFLGESSSVAFGDYLTGGNHVLPTGGMARGWSGLSTSDFVRWTAWQRVEPAAAARLAGDVAALAGAEGLPAHAAAARRAGACDPGTDAAPRRPGPRARAALAGMSAYSARGDTGLIELGDNTNLFGVPPAALAVLRAASGDDAARYPSAQADALRAALADYAGVRPEEIVTGCGSDDVIDSAFRAFAAPGERVAFPDPTFTMLPAFARVNGLTPVAVPLTREGDLDADAMLASGARILYLCSPNNPTGGAFARERIERVLDRARGLVVLDEAYAEFAGGEWIRESARRENLLVVRTLSKAFGLAGLRIGYAAGPVALVREVMKARGPYKVGALAERAAVAALRTDREWVRSRAADAVAARARFAAALPSLGLAALPSAAHFVLVPVPDATAAAEALRARGLSVRPFRALTGIGDALRITAGPWPLMESALAALAEAVPCA